VQCTHIWSWTVLTVLWIGFYLTESISLCLDSFLCMHVFCVSLYIAWCSIVTWWGGPGGTEAWSLGPLLPSVLWHCHLTHKNPVPSMTYNVFSGTLNCAQSMNHLGITKSIQSLKIEWWGPCIVMCLQKVASDLHTVQLMPLSPIISCFIKIQNGFTFLVPACYGRPV